ncbi:hypothetical protein J8L88_06920 [Aquimarina sp. MMG015]|uniref:hypothetical protein n=1 Tax=Aquimarina sp. MMG015 TaxID=2822689 RepID=UPI001B3A09A3|nr:hypothetical protein [Aquimarina sp. MMG015]MBQ4802585.1 hypothetical protein [Aquimarina sp. MMG015]
MKQTLLSCIASLLCTISFAQSANIDRENFKTSYVNLPSKPILDDSKRTYSINTGSITIPGFSKVKTGGTLDINYKFHGTKIGTVDIKKEKHEKKDKDGKVLSVSYTYTANVNYASSATLSVNNATNANAYEKSYSESETHTSGEFSTYKKAQDYYNNNRYNLRDKYKSSHKSQFLSSARGHLTSTYGYDIESHEREFFWILRSKKHPEFAKHQEAYQTLQSAFEKMKYNASIDSLKTEVQPVIDYFNSVIPNYQGKKRKIRKVRYASYYNIAKIYYYLDEPEKVKEYAQKIIDNDYDKSDGKYFNRIADQLIEDFKANETKSRHFEVVTEDLSDQEEDQNDISTDIEVNQAYLITKENDTTLVDIKTSDINKIAYSLKTVEYDQNGKPFGTRVRKAKKCKELVFIDGDHYRNIKFKESSIKNGEVDAGQMILGGATDKLCKVLFESEKINLYLFNNKELVILPAGSEKGKSTMSTGYVFGFKKNLTKLAEGCTVVQEKIANKEYKNNQEDLLRFCKELTNCNVE